MNLALQESYILKWFCCLDYDWYTNPGVGSLCFWHNYQGKNNSSRNITNNLQQIDKNEMSLLAKDPSSRTNLVLLSGSWWNNELNWLTLKKKTRCSWIKILYLRLSRSRWRKGENDLSLNLEILRIRFSEPKRLNFEKRRRTKFMILRIE
jgi:hypothetical protein